MYLPAHFEESRPEVLAELVRRHPLGLLVTQSADDTLAADAIPWLLDIAADGTRTLRGHVARANPVWRQARGDIDALVVFQGPQAYVSPSLYASKTEHGKVVPTWNYIMVQARGRFEAMDDAAWTLVLVTRLTERHESPRAAPWAVSDAPAEFVDRMLGMIVGVQLRVASMTGKWKTSQNRSATDRAGVREGLRADLLADATNADAALPVPEA